MRWVTRRQIRVNRAAFLYDALYASLRLDVHQQSGAAAP